MAVYSYRIDRSKGPIVHGSILSLMLRERQKRRLVLTYSSDDERDSRQIQISDLSQTKMSAAVMLVITDVGFLFENLILADTEATLPVVYSRLRLGGKVLPYLFFSV